MKIEIIDDLAHPAMREHDEFFLANPRSMVYGTSKYLTFLRDVTGGTPLVFIARNGERIIGTLPAFTLTTISGTCMNSLPWYGSNPGILTAAIGQEDAEIRNALIDTFLKAAQAEGMISATIVSNPLEPQEPYVEHFGPCSWGRRTGMISKLKPGEGDSENIKSIFARAHQKTRNQILKAIKGELRCDDGAKYLDDIYHLHKANMEAVNARPKTRETFRAIREHFEYGRDYIAQVTFNGAGVLCAGLVTLLANRTAEYFIPGMDPDYRHLNPMHRLITNGMVYAAAHGKDAWNWGGTRKETQAGVFHFKERWGPEQRDYSYFTKITNTRAWWEIKKRHPQDVIEEFNGFFVAPFHMN